MNHPRLNLMYLDELIPIVDRNNTLRWMKGIYSMAEKAMRYGYNTMTVLQLPQRAISAEAFLSAVDVKQGHIGANLALVLVELIEGQILPESMIDAQRNIDAALIQKSKESDWHAFAA